MDAGILFPVWCLVFGSLLFWPIWMLVHRKWNLAARRLLLVFLINLFIDAAYLSLWHGPWRTDADAYAPIFGLPITNVVLLGVSILVCRKPTQPLSRARTWTSICLAGFVGYLGVDTRFLLDWNNHPFCHKAVYLEFIGWTHSNASSWTQAEATNAFPNVRGSMRDSMAEVPVSWGETDWSGVYNYVPGLHEDDPGDLVLAYYNRPTRWIWHGQPPSIFNPKAWIVVPVDFGHAWGRKLVRPGEESETLTTSQFRERLQKTLDFLRTNNRPYWQAVVAEQNRFLDSITNRGSQ